MNKIPEGEEKIDESRERHKHNPVKGGYADNKDKDFKYCWDCDMYYYVYKQ